MSNRKAKSRAGLLSEDLTRLASVWRAALSRTPDGGLLPTQNISDTPELISWQKSQGRNLYLRRVAKEKLMHSCSSITGKSKNDERKNLV
jgi:hypothetical protein